MSNQSLTLLEGHTGDDTLSSSSPPAAWEINWKSDKEHLRLRVLSWESIWWDNPDLVIHDQTFLQWPSEWSGDKLIRREKNKKNKTRCNLYTWQFRRIIVYYTFFFYFKYCFFISIIIFFLLIQMWILRTS